MGRGRASETADVVAGHGNAAKPKAEQHGCAHGEMIPGAAVVTGPGGGVALRAGVRGPGQHEWALVDLQLAQAFVGGANIFHSVDVVDGAVIESCSVVEAVPGVKRHGFVGALEKRRLVHVVSKTG